VIDDIGSGLLFSFGWQEGRVASSRSRQGSCAVPPLELFLLLSAEIDQLARHGAWDGVAGSCVESLNLTSR
jgi:hypothetical protein